MFQKTTSLPLRSRPTEQLVEPMRGHSYAPREPPYRTAHGPGSVAILQQRTRSTAATRVDPNRRIHPVPCYVCLIPCRPNVVQVREIKRYLPRHERGCYTARRTVSMIKTRVVAYGDRENIP
jgi:hypothetical protein